MKTKNSVFKILYNHPRPKIGYNELKRLSGLPEHKLLQILKRYVAEGLIELPYNVFNNLDCMITIHPSLYSYEEKTIRDSLRFWLPIAISNTIAVIALIVSILAYLRK